MPREFKHYELRPARIPHTLEGFLASVVPYTLENGSVGHCYVKFSKTLIAAAGKKLPRGISKFDPAYLHVFESAGVWHVWVCYLRTGLGVELWETPTKPHWLITGKDHAYTPTRAPASAITTRASRAGNQSHYNGREAA